MSSFFESFDVSPVESVAVSDTAYQNHAIFFPIQAMGCVTAVSASVHQTGRARTAIAPDAQTPACPTWVYSAAAGASVFVGSVSVHSRGPTGPHVTSALLAQTLVP